ncbi:MAG: transporter [Nitrospira sp. CG24B]|nr:MAG: transporter [Nitrospira sp. CG24B]
MQRWMVLWMMVLVIVVGFCDNEGLAADPTDKRPQQATERNWQISFTPSYSHGNFGTNTTSEFIYAPFSIRRFFSKGDISLVIPSVTAITDGRTTVVGNTAFRVDDNSGSGSGGSGGSDDNCRKDNSGPGNNNDVPCGTTTRIAGQKVTTTGIGDVILRGRYYLVEEQDYMPLIAVTARLKFPTANASQGLGTGEFDHGYGVEVSKLIGASWLVFFDGGYNFIGDPDRADGSGTLGLRNQYWYDVGAGYYVTKDLLTSVYFEEYRALRPGLPNARDVFFSSNYRLSAAWRLNGGVAVGLSNGAPDYVVSIGTSYRF